MIMMKKITKTEVTSNTEVTTVNLKNIIKDYHEELANCEFFRVDIPREICTILGTRYHEPKSVKVYKDENDTMVFSILDMPYEWLAESNLYWSKVNCNPQSAIEEDDDVQFFLLPPDDIQLGKYTMTVVDGDGEYERHVKIQRV